MASFRFRSSWIPGGQRLPCRTCGTRTATCRGEISLGKMQKSGKESNAEEGNDAEPKRRKEQAKGQSEEPSSRVPSRRLDDASGHACPAASPGVSKSSPGEAASTVWIPAFLNSLPRWLMRLKCSLSGFLRSIVKMPAGDVHPTSETSSTWPMPVPFPEAFTSGSHLLADCSTKRLISLQVVVFDWLVLGRPAVAPSCLKLGRRLTARQWTVVHTLEHLSFDGNTQKFVDACTVGRAAAKVEGYEVGLGVLARAMSAVQSFDGAYSSSS